ncbi:reverse transcriptase [Plakobranchus ocellatus]|uniref:Reverse transcriptase n=1 Tax=Plakobranchus ocellatus TaxID=259542 RepID=A0AAV4BHQ6_9GAST|nr:reverse transcriptase [Plakobranchus ocellatus]
MLIPKHLCPLLVYDICSTTVEAIEAKINKYTRKWLGVPPGLSDVAMYCRKAKLKLPMKSILEEYKCGKARLLTMLEESDDSVVKTVQPSLKTGRKWKVTEAVDEAKECLKMKEIIGQTQTDRRGLGSTTAKWWSKTKGKEKRDMIIDEIRNKEDSTRVQKAVQQPQQGQWTNWDTAIQRSLTCNDIWHMAPLRISFLIRSVYDLLPSNANLVRWGKMDDPTCPLCQAKGEIQHSSTSSTVFATEGGVKKWHGGSITINTHRKGLLDGCDDWVVSADLPEWERYPDVIRKTALRPVIVIHSASTQQIIRVELNVPYESRMEEAHTFKEGKYLDLTKELKKGWL